MFSFVQDGSEDWGGDSWVLLDVGGSVVCCGCQERVMVDGLVENRILGEE